MFTRSVIAVCAMLSLVACVQAQGASAPTSIGWRGNWTGLYPDSKAPIEWSIVSTGPVQGMKCAAVLPAAGSDGDASPVEAGLVDKWLGVGPFAVEDGGKAFDAEQIPDEAKLAPREGDKVGELSWTPVGPKTDGVSFPSVNATGKSGKPNQVGYATTCLFAPKAGKVRAVVEHVVGMKMYVNGKQVYADNRQQMGLSSDYGLSNTRIASTYMVSPSFEFDVKQGWNRMTIKLVSPNRGGWNDLTFYMRLTDAPGTPYEKKNVLWMTPLPDQSHATPIVVDGKVFVMSEPDELTCVDKNTGKILWNATNNYFDAIPQAELDASPALKEKVAPIAKALREWKDPVERWELRKKLMDALEAVDKKYAIPWKGPLRGGLSEDMHLAGHFGITGYCTTPVSDGKHVYVWTVTGVAACYDLDGRRVWIRRMETNKIFYTASPALIDGKLAVYMFMPDGDLYGLDTATGRTLWKQPKVLRSHGTLIAARIAGTGVFIGMHGDVLRASDGHVLWQSPSWPRETADINAPVVIGDVMYLPRYGFSQLYVVDFTGCTGDIWKPKHDILNGPKGVPPSSVQMDRAAAASPLVYDGLAYGIDWYGTVYIFDLKNKTAVWKDLGFKGLFSYNAITAGASPTLIGKHIVMMDNQGHAVVLEPGLEAKVVARNDLGIQLRRDWAMSTRELTYSPPVVDGNRIYLRAERFLYCIGEE